MSKKVLSSIESLFCIALRLSFRNGSELVSLLLYEDILK